MTTRSALSLFLFLVALFVSACASNSHNVRSQAGEADQSCFTGMIIVAPDGRIELVGCPAEMEVFVPGFPGNTDDLETFSGMVGRSLYPMDHPTKSLLFQGPDAEGRYWFPTERKISSDYQGPRPYLTLVDGVPHIHVANDGGQMEEVALPVAYKVSNAVAVDRKLTPFLDPSILGPPMVEMAHAEGQLIEGRPFHLLCPREQMSMLFAIPNCESCEE